MFWLIRNSLFMRWSKIKAAFMCAKWRFLNLWLLSWRQDDEGDIAFVVCGFLAFVKYKQSTLIRFNGYKLKEATKYQGSCRRAISR